MAEKKADISAWQDFLDLQASGTAMTSNVTEIKQHAQPNSVELTQ